MAYSAGKKGALERRLKELRKESDLIRSDIRTLSRAVKRPEDMESLPKLKSTDLDSRPVPPPSRRDPVQKPVRAAEPAPPPAEGGRSELFGWAPPAGRASNGAPAPSASAQGAAPKVRGATKDERLANYLSSGGFIGGHAPMKNERNVQRNRGIAMLIVVGILAFIVFQLISK
jgi:hypothetical protein